MPNRNNSLQGLSTLTLSIMQSMAEVIKENSYTEKTADSINFYNDRGDVYLPFNIKIWSRKLENGEFPDFKMPSDYARPNSSSLNMQNFTQEFLSNDITTITINDSISLKHLLSKLSSEKEVYGVIFENTDKDQGEDKFLFNPLHPINAFLASSGLIDLPTSGKIHIFTFSERGLEVLNSYNNSAFKKTYEKYASDYHKLFEKFPHIVKGGINMKSTAQVDDSVVENIIHSPQVDSLHANIAVRREENSEDNASIKSLIIPLQLAISGIATPFYGISLLKVGSNGTHGVNLTPMISGNLKNSTANDFSATHDVCTGGYNNRKRSGWLTLSKINIGSMYHHQLIKIEEAMLFIAASKKISQEIWEAMSTDEEQEIP